MNEAVASRQKKFAPWNDPNEVPYVRLVGVTKRFGDFKAIDNISLDIYRREFFALLGPSGCGKTTLLRMLAGFEAPTSGQILLDGVDLAPVPPHRRPVNMMFQSYALFPHMTVEGNIAFGLKQDRLPKDEIATRVEEIIRLVELTKFAKRKPHQLSGGQRQRVALARSLVKKPKLLLLDEPLGALDKKLREQTQFELMTIQEQLGMTFVIVTHDQEEAMTVASRIAVMDHGRFAQTAPPTEIYERPASRFVAGFIGEVNLFDGQVVDSGPDSVTVVCDEAGCRVEAAQGWNVSAGDKVAVALRPEKLSISTQEPADTSVNCIRGVVWDIGYLGNLFVYHVKLGNGKRVTAVQTNARRTIEMPITWEDTVYLTFPPTSPVVLSA